MLELKNFEAGDLDAVFAIQQAAFKPLYETYQDQQNPYHESKERILLKYKRSGTHGYVFLHDEKPVGAVRVNLYPETNSARISALAVLPDYQGQGIAQWALAEIEAIHSHVGTWFLDTILQEPRNCHLYEKLGYQKTGRLEAINPRMTLIYYEKKVSNVSNHK